MLQVIQIPHSRTVIVFAPSSLMVSGETELFFDDEKAFEKFLSSDDSGSIFVVTSWSLQFLKYAHEAYLVYAAPQITNSIMVNLLKHLSVHRLQRQKLEQYNSIKALITKIQNQQYK